MKERTFWMVTLALGVLCAAQSWYIFTRPASAQENAAAGPAWAVSTTTARAYADPWEEMEQWRRQVQRRMLQGAAPGNGDFDGFFNDSFFSRRFSAFDQMDRIQRELLGAFSGAERDAFGGSWDRWMSDRLGMRDFATEISHGEKETTMTVTIPGLDGKNADIDVNRDRVKLSFTARRTDVRKENGREARSESVQSYMKVLPVPEGADGEKAKVAVEGDKVRIVFPKKGAS